MSTLQEIKAIVDQVDPTVLKEGKMGDVAMSALGQLFTADWHTRLALAGVVYTMPLGGVSAGGAHDPLTGLATVDNDKPEVVIAIDTGWLIPIEITVNISVDDLTAYDQVDDLLFIADRSQTVPAGEAGNIVTALNNLDGGAAFSGRCYDTIGTEITNPVTSDVLAYKYWELTQLSSELGGNASFDKNYHKKFDIPKFLKGPCSIIGHITCTVTPTYFGSVVFAHLPVGWITIS